MKIAVSAAGDSMNAQLSEQFGRCPYFVIFDSETLKYEPFLNPGKDMSGGAGPEAVRLVLSKDAEVVLTSAVGPNAKDALDAAEIKIGLGFSSHMTVQEAVNEYLKDSA